jgi:hypothetical protein
MFQTISIIQFGIVLVPPTLLAVRHLLIQLQSTGNPPTDRSFFIFNLIQQLQGEQ